MKHTRKLLSLLLALVMVFALAGTAMAATVTVPSNGILKDHTFTAYQIFSGREEGGILSDVKWGSGINSDDFLAALKADTTYGSLFTDCTDAVAVAKVLGDNNTNTTLANAVAKLAYTNKSGSGTALSSGENTLDDGYYLVVDTTANVGEGGAYNTALLQVVGNINITVKTDAPTVEKKVLEDDKYNQDGGYGEGYNDVADYNMGDAVPFHLIGSVPDMSRYDTYKYIFHDTLSAGLTLNENTIKVYVAADKAGTDKTEITGWTKAVDGQSFTVSFTDLKTVSGVSQGKYIIVEYTATLNQNAAVGLDGNPNTVYLEYSNKPDQSGSGDNNTGNTPEDKVIVFTYELDTTKVDGQDNTKKLEGAEFKLHNADNKWAIVNSDGKVTGWADTEEGGSTLTSDANGLFKVIGLDDGTYYLKETKAPTGYNLLSSEITVVITATTTNGQTWTDGKASSALTNLAVTADGTAGTGNTSTGIAGITVANNKGSTLPETGGIGTTIFYVLGSVLVLAAVVLLVTKKRMSTNG
ncbi:MAG: SpaH/EbpB family LPXTG-anchored major pilin [Eubacteriales bacterium]|nr:SpaH/EbpB family LPXTG-anchored major pilin [Eubacteriales bacterium]